MVDGCRKFDSERSSVRKIHEFYDPEVVPVYNALCTDIVYLALYMNYLDWGRLIYV